MLQECLKRSGNTGNCTRACPKSFCTWISCLADKRMTQATALMTEITHVWAVEGIFLSSPGHAVFGQTPENSPDRKILVWDDAVYQIWTGLKWQPESNLPHSVEANTLDPLHLGSRPAQRTGQTPERLMEDLLSVSRYPFSSSQSSHIIQHHLSRGMAGLQTECVEMI